MRRLRPCWSKNLSKCAMIRDGVADDHHSDYSAAAVRFCRAYGSRYYADRRFRSIPPHGKVGNCWKRLREPAITIFGMWRTATKKCSGSSIPVRRRSVIFPPDFAEQIRHGRPTAVQVIVDASDNMTAASAISTAEFIGRLQAEKAMRVQIFAQTGRVWEPPYTRCGYGRGTIPDLVSEFFMVPGIMGIVLTMTLVVATSMAIVREREQGTLEQLPVTPLATTELMLGKIIPYVFIGYIQITLILILGQVVFDVPFAGSVVLFYLLATLFLWGCCPWGY